MNTQRLKIQNPPPTPRSVLDCGSALPLFPHQATATTLREHPSQSARGLAQSKTWRQLATLFVFLALPLIPALAQNFTIDWFTIGGGGGSSTGGALSVRGTIGQPDAGKMSGGNFSIDGGFWGIIAPVQTPGAPLLAITRTPTNTIAVSWPSAATGFVLQENTNGLGTVDWSTVLTTPIDDGTRKTVIVNPPIGNRFYRLFKP